MSVTTIATITAGTYPIEQIAVPSTAIAVGKSSCTVTLDLTGRDSASTLVWDADLSQDGGTTWTHLDGATIAGAPAMCGPDEGPMTPCPSMISNSTLPNPANASRRIRGTITISGAPYRTLVPSTVTLS